MWKDQVVHSVAEIVLVNHDKLESGVLQQQLEEVSYKALPSALVDKVEIDVAKLRIGDTIKVKKICHLHRIKMSTWLQILRQLLLL